MNEQHVQASIKKIVYIISENFHSSHLEQLINALTKNQIPLQLQKDHDCIGVPLDRRYFVVVDNKSGVAVLGPWFTSLLLFIVGFPKKGRNKKNHYCTKVSQVLDKYKQFCELPQFVKMNFLSSSVTSKSMLKSSKSTKTFESKAVSVSDQSQQKQKRMSPSSKIYLDKKIYKKRDQQSKVLLYLSQSDEVYNKWIFKIAASNPKKFSTIQSLSDLSLTLSVCRSKLNYLIVNQLQYNSAVKNYTSDLQIILHSQNQLFKDQLNVISICNSHKAVITVLRQIGFEAISLKDIDKSIVKYGKLFTKNKLKSHKKIVWNNQQNMKKQQPVLCEDQNKCKEISDQYMVRIIKQNQKATLNSIAQSQKSYLGSQAFSVVARSRCMSVSGVSCDSQKQNPDKKRASIQSFMKNHFKSQQNDLQKTVLIQTAPMSTIENFINKQSTIKNQDFQQKKQNKNLFKLKRLKLSKSTCQKPRSLSKQTSQSTQKTKSIKRSIIQPIMCQSLQTNKKLSNNFNPNNSCNYEFNSLKLLQSLQYKSESSCKMTESLNIKQTMNKQNNYLQQSKKTTSSEVNNNKNTLINKLIPKKQIKIMKNMNNVDKKQCILLWKDFNYQIQNSLNFIKSQHKQIQFKNKSFYFTSQLKQIFDQQKDRLIILIDEVEIQKYLNFLKSYVHKQTIVAIYIFQKQYFSEDNFVKNISQVVKQFQNLKQIITILPHNQYADQSVQIAVKIMQKFFIHKNN